MDRYLKDYLYCGDNGLAVSEALRDCRNGDTLHLGGGKLEFDGTYATPVNYYLPRYSDRSKYYAIYGEGLKNIVIDGDGASLILKGDISGFGFDRCENLTLRNFSMDYELPYYWQAMITEANEKYFEVEFDETEYPCEYDPVKKVYQFKSKNSDLFWEDGALLANEFDPLEKRPTATTPDYFLCAGLPHPVYSFMSVLVDTEYLDSSHFRFHYKDKSVSHTAGNYLVVANHDRRNNNIHFHKCKNVTLENIDMYSSASFGVISLLVENLKIKNVNSLLRPGSDRMLAVIADMFHCVNCSGNIEISQCRIENMKDDGINIHSLLCEVKKILNPHTMIVEFPYFAKRAINLFQTGEKLHCLKGESFQRGGELTVRSSEFAGQYHLRIETEEEISPELKGYFLESSDAMPKIHIHDCRTGNNRGRGFLVSSNKPAVIENNTFYNMSAGISVNGASVNYMEGGAVDGLVIRKNFFAGCAYRRGSAVNIHPAAIKEEYAKPYHKNVSIVDNLFKLTGNPLIYARLVKGLLIENNQYDREDGQQPFEKAGFAGVEAQQCVDVRMDHAFVFPNGITCKE